MALMLFLALGKQFLVITVSTPDILNLHYRLGTTTLGILNGVYSGLGQSIGSLIGGSLSSRLGISKAFYM